MLDIVTIALATAATVGALGLTRLMLGIATHTWFDSLHDQIEAELGQDKREWNCTRFHEIMATPRPWYVKATCWLEARHV
jgi:hypothetical protein